MCVSSRLAALLLLVGCAGAGVGDVAPDGVDFSGAAGATTLPSIPVDEEFSAEVLADGHVSHAEMERALAATVACVRSAGYEAELTRFEPRFGWGFETSGATEQEADAADAMLTECWLRYGDRIAETYFQIHGLGQEERVAYEAGVVDCLERKGVDVRERGLDRLYLELRGEESRILASCEAVIRQDYR